MSVQQMECSSDFIVPIIRYVASLKVYKIHKVNVVHFGKRSHTRTITKCTDLVQFYLLLHFKFPAFMFIITIEQSFETSFIVQDESRHTGTHIHLSTSIHIIIQTWRPFQPDAWSKAIVIGTDIQIINSTVRSTAKEDGGPGIYHPQRDSTLTVYNSTVEGYTGIAIKGGYLEVISSEIIGNGDKLETPVGDNSGSADPGDAIYIENNYEKNSISVVIREEENSGTAELKATRIESKNDHAVRIFDETRKNVKITIYGGTFSGKGEINDEWLAEGMKTQGTNGAYEVVPIAG